MNPGILIQARLKSKRLPYKLLRPLGGTTMIAYLIRRLKPLGFPVVLCTSKEGQDIPLTNIAKQEGIYSYRGDADDLALRFLGAMGRFDIDAAIRVTADNPLVDINVMLYLLASHELSASKYSYVIGLPKGLGCDIFKPSALEAIIGKPDQEHEFKNYLNNGWTGNQCFYEEWRGDIKQDVTVDTWDDYLRVRKIVDGY